MEPKQSPDWKGQSSSKPPSFEVQCRFSRLPFGILAVMLVHHASLDLWVVRLANFVRSRNLWWGTSRYRSKKWIHLNRTSKHNSSTAIAVHKEHPGFCWQICGSTARDSWLQGDEGTYVFGVTYPRGPGQSPLLDITELSWGGVGWGWWRSLHLNTSLMLRRTGLGWGGVGWGWWRSLRATENWGGTQVLDRTWMWMKKFIPHSIKNRGNSVLNPRLWDYVYQFVYRHNKDLWETTWRSKTTFCVLFHISRTSYKNRITSDCVVNHMILDYANVWHHRASRRRVTMFFPMKGAISSYLVTKLA